VVCTLVANAEAWSVSATTQMCTDWKSRTSRQCTYKDVRHTNVCRPLNPGSTVLDISMRSNHLLPPVCSSRCLLSCLSFMWRKFGVAWCWAFLGRLIRSMLQSVWTSRLGSRLTLLELSCSTASNPHGCGTRIPFVGCPVVKWLNLGIQLRDRSLIHSHDEVWVVKSLI
jgi:hypothetical protein